MSVARTTERLMLWFNGFFVNIPSGPARFGIDVVAHLDLGEELV